MSERKDLCEKCKHFWHAASYTQYRNHFNESASESLFLCQLLHYAINLNSSQLFADAVCFLSLQFQGCCKLIVDLFTWYGAFFEGWGWKSNSFLYCRWISGFRVWIWIGFHNCTEIRLQSVESLFTKCFWGQQPDGWAEFKLRIFHESEFSQRKW